MKRCDQYIEWIWLSLYDELDAESSKQLKQHLQSCERCTAELAEARQVFGTLDKREKSIVSPEELAQSRERLHRSLLQLQRKGSVLSDAVRKFGQWFSWNDRTVLRYAAAAAILLIGVFIGRQTYGPAQTSQAALLSGMTDINYVHYEPDSKQLIIGYNSIVEEKIRGDATQPEIQRMMAYALMHEERPNVRLKTVSALSALEELDINLIRTLIDVMQSDENPGVRLKAVKVLNAIPISSDLKNMLIDVFTKVVLKEENSAIRNEAINGLSRIGNSDIVPFLYSVAENDTSDYARFKASQHLKKVKIERQHLSNGGSR
ncbi:MAG: HEAT repeat domain-containing protein [candidate division KSB1 bacterium]|jgi:hypothetical protein|nr:HEAT repeat domain-containing protein [candidate division KSB1 bacterium]